MPLVKVVYNPERFDDTSVESLQIVLDELVPAYLHVESNEAAHLTPGSIELFMAPVGPHDTLHTDVFVEVEAMYFKERKRDLDRNARKLKSTLRNFFPGNEFAVWIKLVKAGWASDVPDPDFDYKDAMHSSQAAGRARQRLKELAKRGE